LKNKLVEQQKRERKKKHTNIGSRDVPKVVLRIIIIIVVDGDGGNVTTLVAVVVVVDGGDGDGKMNYRGCTSLS
jgi:hypothetical protein